MIHLIKREKGGIPVHYLFEEELLMLIPGLLSGIPTGLFSLAAYVLTALSIYTVAKRRGLRSPWLAWVPVVNCWLLGSISDQYQYVVKGENKAKRKWLLVLSLLKAVLLCALLVYAAVLAMDVVSAGYYGNGMVLDVVGPVLTVLGLTVPYMGIVIAVCVIRYMALFDVYRSLDPANSVLFLVLSILFSPTEAFFLFFNREKDLGMPPRKKTVLEAEPVTETWETV